MRVMKSLLSILTVILLVCGCQRSAPNATVATTGDNTTLPPSTAETTTPSVKSKILAKGKEYSIEEIQQGILKAFNTEFYYASDDDVHLNRNLILNKALEYDLVFVDDGVQSYVILIVNNLEHPLSTEEKPLYSFGVAFSKQGMAEKFHSFGKQPRDALTFMTEERGGVYLGNYSLHISEITKPQHEQMSDEWKWLAEAAIRRYMDKNDFYGEKDKNLQPGKYHIHIKGFAVGDTDTTVVFEHEDGDVYQGFYYFVHDISKDTPADLNHVELVSELNANYAEWIEKVRENATLSMEYSVQE